MSFGFDPTRVFGDSGIGNGKRRKKLKGKRKTKKMDDMQSMVEESMNGFGGKRVNGADLFGKVGGGIDLGIDTFSLADPSIDSLQIGSDFGERVIAPAGLSNGKGGDFLGIIGSQQVRVPSVVGGRVRPIGAVSSKKRRARARARTPLQKQSGSEFGKVDQKFGEVLFSNIEGARTRIRNFRKGRRTKSEEELEKPMLVEMATEAKETRETPQLPDLSQDVRFASPRSATRPRTELTRGRTPF